ncbi:aminotransferase class I/II-fold pyridoxal phosphate-dependent enzyme [Salinibacterium sp. SYSU T00001]|uniref:aminotransferase class I/II-fold pyridoxal phosphate-dependent enzyme n=1 Tax=Homoserinimonas sedimenticola TaxID=2986805 RepID=UPI0022365898|nr:aminotransferase class I/II-fold pyridoxal phosphate-dependent enzyme [Salinibacterium sedimenticola]MCW4384314.1 aminotransferase class I/II-fold pyridoxal phosphate-dependent enzyme [Salinibacterium sedimenticola]
MTIRDARLGTSPITGESAAEIAESIRTLVDRGILAPGDALPPVRALAEDLGVNRNTVVAAYRLLSRAGAVETRGRGGTRIATRAIVPLEGYAPDSVLRDVANGNPDPTLIPDLSPALATLAGRPVLYGEPTIDPSLERWARAWMAEDLRHQEELRLTVTGGAVDALERLFADALTRGDLVGLEDPCFLSALRTVHVGGYRPHPIPVDEEGMTVDGLQAALEAGVRAIVCTPRAHNPTGASLTPERAAALREALAEHPHILVIEDDHFSMLSRRPYVSIIGSEHERWALIRSVSKFLGPDLCLAITASDAKTADRLAQRLTPGSTWVSHLLQRLVVALVDDADVMAGVERAAEHYSARNAAFAEHARTAGLPCRPGDGLSVWLPLPAPARAVTQQLMRRGWLVRPGDEFLLADDSAAHHLRLTVHDLDDEDAHRLATDIAAAVETVLHTA